MAAMSPPGRRYGYVGPPELREAVVAGTEGQVIRRTAALDAWTAVAGQGRREDGHLRRRAGRSAAAGTPAQ
ncbi:hypothetical protein [Streptomyces sp. ID05-39B]|uniref:hypothetical protein n=1 Tax=Streptomyces sp. ID05-39B TaxID=3028664 RepID=UPI0029BFDBF3|nr:hypothetical protein [Streptomyces sp. ID05-39B]